MLDENLRVLSRRINDMEVELTDKKEKIRNLEKANIDVQSRLDSIHDEHAYARQTLEKQMRQTIDNKEEQCRRIREEKQ
jgi:predicted  nucleic acid-binding Zn ribbon protein